MLCQQGCLPGHDLSQNKIITESYSPTLHPQKRWYLWYVCQPAFARCYSCGHRRSILSPRSGTGARCWKPPPSGRSHCRGHLYLQCAKGVEMQGLRTSQNPNIGWFPSSKKKRPKSLTQTQLDVLLIFQYTNQSLIARHTKTLASYVPVFV